MSIDINDSELIEAREARRLSDKTVMTIAEKKDEDIKDKAKELFLTAKSFINAATKKGEYETMMCIRYGNREECSISEAAAYKTVNLLTQKGYSARVNNNIMIKEVLISIDWE